MSDTQSGSCTTTDSGPVHNTFDHVGVIAKKSISLSAFGSVNVNTSSLSKGRASVAGVQDEISNVVFTILPTE
jgi:hypothetical protein